MKKCRYCGTPQSDERHTCVDCGRPLPKPLSAEEAEAIEDALDDRLDAMSDRTDAFYVSRTDQILGIIGVLGFIAACILISVSGIALDQIYDAQNISQSGFVIQSSREKALDQCILYAIIAIVCFLVSVPMLLFPKLMWYLDTLKLRLWYDFNPSPSAFAETVLKITKYLIWSIGAGALAYAAVWMFF